MTPTTMTPTPIIWPAVSLALKITTAMNVVTSGYAALNGVTNLTGPA